MLIKIFVKVNIINSAWICEYKEIVVNNKNFKTEQKSFIIFNSGQHYIYVNQELWDFLIEMFLEEKQCVIETT